MYLLYSLCFVLDCLKGRIWQAWKSDCLGESLTSKVCLDSLLTVGDGSSALGSKIVTLDLLVSLVKRLSKLSDLCTSLPEISASSLVI